MRVFLKAGEEMSLYIPIDEKAFTVVDDLGQRIPGSGSYTLYAGLGQPDGRTRELYGKEALSVKI